MLMLNYDKINFPVSQKNININIFGYENDQPYSIYMSQEKILMS